MVHRIDLHILDIAEYTIISPFDNHSCAAAVFDIKILVVRKPPNPSANFFTVSGP
jgi:hypothetical protein